MRPAEDLSPPGHRIGDNTEVSDTMKQKTVPSLPLLVTLLGYGLLVAFPAEAAAGARRGLNVCAGVIVPSLFPFLAFSGLCTALGFSQRLAALLRPVMARIGLSPYAAAPLLLGLIGGYPVGASAVAELVRSGTLTPEEGAALLPWCNNTGPAFLIGAAGTAAFGSAGIGCGLYLCHVLAALTLALLLRSKRRGNFPASLPRAPEADFASAFPDCVRAAAAAAFNISAFVVFFSVLTALLDAVGIASAVTAFLALRLGTGLQFARSLLTGLLELGSGIGCIAGLPPTPGNLALASFLIGFGGLSVHCQTLSVLSGTKIKCARHFVGRIAHGGISALFTFLLFTLLRI